MEIRVIGKSESTLVASSRMLPMASLRFFSRSLRLARFDVSACSSAEMDVEEAFSILLEFPVFLFPDFLVPGPLVPGKMDLSFRLFTGCKTSVNTTTATKQ